MDRHYLGIVAAEARRLGRQLRAPEVDRTSAKLRIAEHEHPEMSH